MKTVCVAVSNDIYADNRVLKTCKTLAEYGLNVVILGKKTSKSPKLDIPYKSYRIKVLFKKNVFYYAELNIRMFFYLLCRKQNILWANDLDTLLPVYLISKLKNIPLIYDSHELFCYTPELKQGSFQQHFWLGLERMIVPKLKNVITVCNPIKTYFRENYKITASVVRNIPFFEEKNQEKKHYPLKEKYIIWQGAANIDRGLEELVDAMVYIDCKLYILGRGDIIHSLQERIAENNLQDKVKILGRKSFGEMMALTRGAVLGISIDKPTNGNYKISLPNKIFEYINSATPVLYSDLAEISLIEEQYRTGIKLQSYEPKELANQISRIINDNGLLQNLSNNCIIAQRHLNWQNEQKEIIKILDTLR